MVSKIEVNGTYLSTMVHIQVQLEFLKSRGFADGSLDYSTGEDLASPEAFSPEKNAALETKSKVKIAALLTPKLLLLIMLPCRMVLNARKEGLIF